MVPEEERNWYSDPLSPSAESAFRIHHPDIYSMLRTSVVPTMLAAGVKINVIPSTAEAALDIRALPDEDPAKLFASLAQVIKDPNIEIVPEDAKHRPSPPSSSLRTEMFAALEFAQRVVAPDAITLPLMTNSGSDSAFLRAKGVQAYGITLPGTDPRLPRPGRRGGKPVRDRTGGAAAVGDQRRRPPAQSSARSGPHSLLLPTTGVKSAAYSMDRWGFAESLAGAQALFAILLDQ
jgi:hypothetical protein